MHRIDGPGATVDNRFTDGDPVGGVQATVVTDDWANDIQEELMSILVAASISPIKGTQNQVLSAIRKITSGVVGQSRNLKAQIVTAAASAAWTADELIVESALGGFRYCLASFNKTINLATTGAGGMDIGTAPTSGYVAIYAICNPLTGVSALLATNATSAAAPEIYGGANMPAGYTASALVSVTPTDAAKLFKVMVQSDRHIAIAGVTVMSSTSLSTTPVAVNCSAAIPFNAKTVDISWAVNQTSAGQPVGMGVGSTSGGLGFVSIFSVSTSGTSSQTTAALMAIATPQTMYMSAQTANGATYASGITGYTF